MFAWLRMGFYEYDICGENLDELSDCEESVAFRFVLVSACFIWFGCGIVSFFIPFLFLLLFLTELLWDVPDGVVGWVLVGQFHRSQIGGRLFLSFIRETS
jgi:hypothetical protein